MSHQAELFGKFPLFLGKPCVAGGAAYPIVIGRPDIVPPDKYPVVIANPELPGSPEIGPIDIQARQHFAHMGYPIRKIDSVLANQGVPVDEGVATIREWLADLLINGTHPPKLPPLEPLPTPGLPLEDLDLPQHRSYLGGDENMADEVDARLTNKHFVNLILDALSPHKRALIMQRYGLEKETTPRTLRSIGDEYGLTDETIRGHLVSVVRNIQSLSNDSRPDNPLFGLRDALD
jgi:hypothetical protein